MSSIFHVQNPDTHENFYFLAWELVEQSIAITWSKTKQKPAIHRLVDKEGEWCVGDPSNPSLLITKINLDSILLSEARHL